MSSALPPSVADQPAAACRSAESYLEWCIGLDPQTVGSAAIARAVRVRMEACGITREREYLERLVRDQDEHTRFVDEVVVPESWFFRDMAVFEVLRDVALRRPSTNGSAPFRVLCVPCAAGEEPYSVAMALLESGLDEDHFRVDAADVSRAALARAANGVYSPNAFRGDDLAFRDRWFQPRGTSSQIDDAVRKQVDFFWGNMLDESFGADRGPYDVIFCRNLLIYLTADARGRVERTVERLLVPDGLLVVGAAEPPILKGGWFPASGQGAFTLRRGMPVAADRPSFSRPHLWPTPRAAQGPKEHERARSSTPSSDHPAVAHEGSRFGEPGATSLDDLLQEAHVLADAGRHADALSICERHLQAAGPSSPVFFLLAMLHQAAGDLDRAEACLHKTLYLDPDRDDAFLALSRVATERGDEQMAARYRQSAARVIVRKGTS